MTPNATQARAREMLELYSEAEERLLTMTARRLNPAGNRNTSQWVQRKLREVKEMRTELETAIDRLANESADLRGKLFLQAHDEGADGLFRELGIAGAPTGRAQALAVLIDDMDGRFSELHGRILRNAEDVYRTVLSEALPMATMGVESTQQAIQKALSRFADRGITAFTDRAGRRWGMSEYAEMAVRTGMMNAQIAGYTQEALSHGEDLVIISDHADECPLCAPWERKVLSLTGAQQHHPDCQGTVGDARAAGLFHPNCLHAMTVYVPGLTIRGGSKEGRRTSAQDSSGYANRQRQRYMERMVRRWKRRQAVAITPEEERYSKAYVDKWQRSLRALTGETKLPRKYEREGGRVLLSDAAKKIAPLRIDENGRIIRDSKNLQWLRQGYDRAVQAGDLSALTGFQQYVKTAGEIDRELVGITTADGVRVSGYTTHFIDRIIGSYEKRREPVQIADVKSALTNPAEIIASGAGRRTYRDRESACKVGMNPEIGRLIQTTPLRKGG